MEGERTTTEPQIWERRRGSISDRGALSGFKAPKLPSQIVNRNDAQKRVRMSQDTYENDDDDDNDTNYDYLEEDVDIDNLVIPSSNIVDLGSDGDSDGGEGNAKPLQMQMTELEVEILTAKCVLL